MFKKKAWVRFSCIPLLVTGVKKACIPLLRNPPGRQTYEPINHDVLVTFSGAPKFPNSWCRLHAMTYISAMMTTPSSPPHRKQNVTLQI